MYVEERWGRPFMAGIGGRGGVALGHGCAQFIGNNLAAKPPLPSPRRRPFHPASGIHTSMVMLESDVGASRADRGRES